MRARERALFPLSSLYGFAIKARGNSKAKAKVLQKVPAQLASFEVWPQRNLQALSRWLFSSLLFVGKIIFCGGRGWRIKFFEKPALLKS